jgi:hypothetical protein
MDIGNLFNAAAIDARQTRYPEATIGNATVAYGDPTSVQSARQISFGARFSF